MIRVWWIAVAVLVGTWGAGCSQTIEHAVVDPAEGLSAEHASIRVPHLIEVVAVDGERIQARGILPMREHHVLVLNAGTHRITARPRPAYNLDDEDHAVTYAGSVTLEFDVEADSVYRIVYRPETDAGVQREPDQAIWIEKLLDE